MSLRDSSRAAAPPAPSRLDWAVEALLAALLAFAPFAFGAVQAWAEEVVMALTGAMLLCLLLRLLVARDGGFVWTWAYVPLGLFLLVVVMQLVPLPRAVLEVLTPNTSALKTRLAGGAAASADGGSMTISFYPLVTRRGLRLALAVSAVFVVAVNGLRRCGQVKRVLVVVSAIGGCVALLALAQIATNSSKIYWRVPAAAGAGPFVNRNNYCQFMNLSVGAALGLLLLKLWKAFPQGPVSLAQIVERLSSRQMRAVWYLAGMIVVALASVVLSLSRGGMLSLLIAWSLTIGVLGVKKRLDSWGWIMCALAVGALACVLYVGFDSVYDRLGSLRHLRQYQGRWQLLRDSARVWATFPLLGAGLGTHAFVYPMFDRSTIPALAAHVENEYLQMAEETGIVGLVLVAAFGGIILRDYLRCVRGGVSGLSLAAVGLGAGLLAVLVHSLADFGLHVPANASLAALFCGLMVTMAGARRGEHHPARARRSSPAPRWAVGLCLLAAAGIWAWSLRGADAARRAEGYWRQAQRLEKQMRKRRWAVANADYARLIALTARAVQSQPDNVMYRHWLNVHRWRAVGRVRDPQTGAVVLGPTALRSAERIVADLEALRALCPTFGPAWSLAGQLKRFVLNDPRGAELIRTARRLSPCSASACVAAGLLEAREGAVEVARDDPDRLLAVAEVLKRRGQAALARKARAQAEALLRRRCEGPGASPRTLARAAEICLRRGEFDRAAAYYRRALSAECGQVWWRLNLARALAATGRVAQAVDQVGICLKLRPGMAEARGLLCELRARASAGGE